MCCFVFFSKQFGNRIYLGDDQGNIHISPMVYPPTNVVHIQDDNINDNFISQLQTPYRVMMDGCHVHKVDGATMVSSNFTPA